MATPYRHRRPQRNFSPRRICIAVALTCLPPVLAYALPTGEQVVAGQVQVNRTNASAMTVQQQTPNAIINWQGFSIAGSESVNFQQPSSSSVILNRVTGNNPSEIFGRLTANGKLFLVNPNGVLFGAGASVNVGSLVASTLDIRNEDFLNGRYQFAGQGGTVANDGTITAENQGTVALLGGRVTNNGIVTAKLGSVVLAAGGNVTLDLAGDGLTQISISEAALDAQVENHNAIRVDGGQALLTAHAVNQLSRTVVNQTGVIRANSLTERNGRIALDSGDTGVTLVAGKLDVSGAESGLTGGEIQVLGHHIGLIDNATLDASGHSGGGTILIGGDYQGKNPAVRNAVAVFAGPQTHLRADALAYGNGGKVILWSDETTRAHGSISARGGQQGGDGGFIETSGKFLDTSGIKVDAAAVHGKAGEWLLDPVEIIIDANTTSNVAPSPNFTAVSTPANVNVADIESALNTGTNVSVTTNGAFDVNAEENIIVNANIAKTAGGDAKLGLNAHNKVVISQNIVISSTSGKLDVDLNADLDGINGGAVLFDQNAKILSNGGDVRFYGASDPVNGRATGTPDTIEGTLSGIALGSAALIDTRVGQTAGAPSGSIFLRGHGTEEIIVSGTTFSNPTPGLSLDQAVLQTSNGNIVLNGIGGLGGIGVDIDGGVIQTETGKISIVGWGPGFNGDSPTPKGVNISSSSILATTGSIDIRGRGDPSSPPSSPVIQAVGVDTDDPTIATTGLPGAILISGDSGGAGYGIRLNGGTTIGGASTTGNIVLRAANGGGADMINLAGTIKSSGNLNIRPGGVAIGGVLLNMPTTPIDLFATTNNFSLDTPEIAAIKDGFNNITIGSIQHAGKITVWVSSPQPFFDNLTLQNGGSSNGGIAIDGPLLNPDRLITLSSGGTVKQLGEIQASRLFLHGTQPESNFQLRSSSNNVGTLATRFELPKSLANVDFGDVNFVNSNALTIGSITALGFDQTGNQPVAISAAQSVTGGDLFVRTLNGDLTLKHGIATLGSDITLVTAGAFLNPGGGTLSPGGTGSWRIYASTWVGEDRGGLVPTSPQPNFYNCTFGGTCGVSLPSSGNKFIYTQQPSLTLTADDLSRLQGSQNPLFTFDSVGLVNGDTVADATLGTFSSSAARNSLPGSYAIAGGFSSPTGYQLTIFPATLTVLPFFAPSTPQSARDVPFDSSYVYDKNISLPDMCVATGPLATESNTSSGYDLLGLEWSRVRSKPNLSNCIDLGQRNGCQDF